MTTKETYTINVPFAELYTADDADDLQPIGDRDDPAVSFKISRAEYEAIRAVQQKLQDAQQKNEAPFRFLYVGVSWAVEDSPNFKMNGYEFYPKVAELEITVNGVELVLYHYGYISCCAKADITAYLHILNKEKLQSE